MAQNRLEETVAKAAKRFALEILAAVKGSSLQELMALSQGGAPAGEKKGKPGRKPGVKAAKAVKAVKAPAAAKPRKKRVVKNYPKCAFEGCGKNRFPRGKGYCGDHWKQWKDGMIPAAK